MPSRRRSLVKGARWRDRIEDAYWVPTAFRGQTVIVSSGSASAIRVFPCSSVACFRVRPWLHAAEHTQRHAGQAVTTSQLMHVSDR